MAATITRASAQALETSVEHVKSRSKRWTNLSVKCRCYRLANDASDGGEIQSDQDAILLLSKKMPNVWLHSSNLSSFCPTRLLPREFRLT